MVLLAFTEETKDSGEQKQNRNLTLWSGTTQKAVQTHALSSLGAMEKSKLEAILLEKFFSK